MNFFFGLQLGSNVLTSLCFLLTEPVLLVLAPRISSEIIIIIIIIIIMIIIIIIIIIIGLYFIR